MMKCKCCDGTKTNCGCMCHKAGGVLCGLGLLVLGLVLWMTNYDMMDAAVWKWLLPLALIVTGIKYMVMACCRGGSTGGRCACGKNDKCMCKTDKGMDGDKPMA